VAQIEYSFSARAKKIGRERTDAVSNITFLISSVFPIYYFRRQSYWGSLGPE
jgi:hypothetical protein